MFKRHTLFLVLFAVLIVQSNIKAQLSISATSTAYTINFSSTISGVNSGSFLSTSAAAMLATAPVAGQLDADAWAIVKDGAFSNGSGASTFPGSLIADITDFTSRGTLVTGIGSATIASNSQLAVLPAGATATPGSITLRIQNTTGSTVNQIDLSYWIAAYNDQPRSNSVACYYSSDNATFTDASIIFTSTATGNSSLEQETKSKSITGLSIANNGFFYIRWLFNDVSGSGSRDEFYLDDITITAFASGLSDPPTLTADNSDNNVDNNIDITFTTTLAWQNAITAVKIGGTPLTLTTDYVISDGNIQLKPSGGNTLLRTSGSKSVTIEATGYNNASVTQVINAGAPTANSTATISAALATNTTRTVTATAIDQYNNLVSGYTFKYNATITDADATTDESYTVDGTGRTTSVTDINLNSATNASGVATFNIVIPPTVDANDGISVQVQLSVGSTNVGSAFSFTKIAPQITVTGTDPGSADFVQGSTKNILYRYNFSVANDQPTLNVLNATTGGNYLAADITSVGFKLYYSTDATLDGGDSQIGTGQTSTSTGTGETVTFSGLTQALTIGGNNYIFLTVDVAVAAVVGKTISGSSSTDGNLTYSGSPTFSGSSFGAGNSHNLIAPIPVLLLQDNFNYTNGAALTANGWTAHSSSGSNPISVGTNNGLTFQDYGPVAAGNAALVNNSGEDVNKTLSSTITSGNVYAAFLVNVSAAAAGEEYFAHFGPATIGSLYRGRVFVKDNGSSGINFGLAVSASTGTYSSTAFNYNTTYLLVLKYEIVTGTGNDKVYLQVYSTGEDFTSEPVTYTVTGVPVGTDATEIGSFALRQISTSYQMRIDAIRVSNVWFGANGALPVELTSFTARAIGSVVNLNWETATEVDNNGFDVERNSTGTWQKIGFVEGHGTANSPKYYNFTDKSVTGNKIQYRLRQVDNDGTFEYSNVVEVELAPTTFTLDQNYPNPFNPTTMIRFSLPTASAVTLNVYNTLGEKVVTLLNGVMESGYHQVSFDAANLPSGLYLYEIKAGVFSSIKKMLLMK